MIQNFLWKKGYLLKVSSKNYFSNTLISCIQDCANGSLIGDGFCNDETNNVNCYFDGGDCCGSCIAKMYCSECACYEPEITTLGTMNPLLGDGYCNDETNNQDCNFDGGDCCGPCINTEVCSECECHQESK